MYLLQGVIFCAVVGSNIHWQRTPNPYLAAGIGVFMACCATQAVKPVARSHPLATGHQRRRGFSVQIQNQDGVKKKAARGRGRDQRSNIRN